MKKLFVALLSLLVVLSLTACQSKQPEPTDTTKTYKVGICNYVDDASLNQICENIENQLKKIAADNNVKIDILYDNCNLDANVLSQIISNFIAEKVDLMVAVATPVAIAMQAATEENKIPVIFAAVSDPLACGLVQSLEAPGANISGTSDYLNTEAVMNLIVAADPEIKTVGLLYDAGQDSSTTAINEAKAFLDARNISYIEKNGTNPTEIVEAAEALIATGVTSIFTPSDNTVMAAELSIYEKFAEAGVKHYAGADSFALNGAFVGYGVDYANLGVETANMIKAVLIDGTPIATLSVMTFDNGTATINTDICKQLNISYDEISKAFEPYCTKIQPITTAESFN